MNFLEKLDFLMEKYGLNKRSLSQKSDIPYTTIDAWYKKGYEGLKLTTLRKLNDFFNTTLDYWILDEVTDPNYGKSSGFQVDYAEMEHIKKYRALDDLGRSHIDQMMDWETDRVKIKEKHSARIDELEKKLQKSGPVLRIYPYLRKIAAAGNGFYFDDIPTDTIEAPYMEGADFVIGVNGDSMEPVLSDGDLIYVEKRQIVETGDIGIFIVNSQCYVKKAADEGLVSYNPKYPTIPGTEHIICFGKVLGKVSEDQIKIRTRYTS